jgi:acyl-coenzyme A thioesterase 13
MLRRLKPLTPAFRAAMSSSIAKESFLARAAAARDASVLLGPFQSAGRYDDSLAAAGLETTMIGPDGVECTLTVTPQLTNNYGTLHGGATATLVDIVGTLALLGRDPTRPGVSVEMNQSFCAAAKEGEQLLLSGQVLRYGRSLGFTEVTIRAQAANGSPGKLIAIGRHTKMFAQK